MDNELSLEREYPVGVIDTVAFDTMVRMKAECQNSPIRFFETSLDTTVDNNSAWNHIRNKYQGEIPDDELEAMLSQWKEHRSNIGKVQHFTHLAYKTKRTKAIILDHKYAEILELFGRYLSLTEVHKIVCQDWGMSINAGSLEKFRIEHIAEIQAKQEEYVKTYSNVRLGHKRSRLDELTYLYRDRKSIYELTQKGDDYKLLLQTIEQIRREIEGDKLTIDGQFSIQVEQTLSYHIQNEILQELNIKQLIVSKVAVRMNKNPLKLMTYLENSTYAKFAGFKKPEVGLMEDKIIYPSQSIYNFNDIKEAHERGLIEEAAIIKEEIQEQKALPSREDVKKDIIMRLRAKRISLDNTQNTINAISEARSRTKVKQDINSNKVKLNPRSKNNTIKKLLKKK